MTSPIPLNLVVEDDLSEAVLRVILHQSRRPYVVGECYSRGGYTYIQNTIRGFNHAAKGVPFLVLTDLDRRECAPALIREWLPVPKHPNLLFRVAVTEVEAWVLAHREAFAKFIGVEEHLIPGNVDSIADAKQFLVNLARKSPRREIVRDIVPPPGSTKQQGSDYNPRLISFVEKSWKMKTAKGASPSLKRTIELVEKFSPTWTAP